LDAASCAVKTTVDGGVVGDVGDVGDDGLFGVVVLLSSHAPATSAIASMPMMSVERVMGSVTPVMD
jgi:hypothetical protein